MLRNSILDLLEDAQAEYRYQEKEVNQGRVFDAQDLVDILGKANDTCDEWFNFIPEEDVREAELAVSDGV